MPNSNQKVDYYTCPYTDHLCGYHSQCHKCHDLMTIDSIYGANESLFISQPVKEIRYATTRTNGLYHLSRNLIVHMLSRIGFDKETINMLLEENHLQELSNEELWSIWTRLNTPHSPHLNPHTQTAQLWNHVDWEPAQPKGNIRHLHSTALCRHYQHIRYSPTW